MDEDSGQDPDVFETLGPPFREYRSGFRFLIMVLFVLSFFAFVAAFPFLFIARTNLGDVLFSGFCVCVITGVLLYYLFKRRTKVKVYRGGIQWTRGRECISMHWNEIESIWEASFAHEGDVLGLVPVPGPTYSSTILEDQGGRKITLDNHLANFKELSQLVHAQTVPRIRSEAVDTYAAGETIHFGPFALSRERLIYNERKAVSFNDITRFSVDAGRVVVRARGHVLRWAVVPIRKIPNVVVFLELMNRRLGTVAGVEAEGP
jgi:hypothetical protein